MPEVSAAIIVLGGAILIVAGVIPSTITEPSRERLVRIGCLVVVCGLVAWGITFFGYLVSPRFSL